jgi:hypothetical protein
MIIIDLNQVMIANMMAQLGNHTNADINEDLLRHMVLNSIRNYRSKFVNEYGEVVIANDGKQSWRKDFFPYYKAHRRKFREESEMDWGAIFTALNQIREELRDNFPYKYIHVDGAEADDIIGTICHKYGRQLGKHDPILILSGDKDFIQLQTYSNVEQFDPIRKRWIKHSNPTEYLLTHIIKGDRGDGVPNILSKDDCLINGRQTPCRQKYIDHLSAFFCDDDFSDLSDVDFKSEEHARNFNRNMHLIDLRKTPDDIRLNIMEQFNREPTAKRSNLFNYFIEKRLKGLVEHIGDF